MFLVSYVLEPVSYGLFSLGLLYYFIKFNPPKFYLVTMIFFLVMTGLQAWALFHTKGGNLYIYNMFYVVNSITFSYFFYHLLSGKAGKRLAVGSGVVTLIYFIINISIVHETYFDSIGYVISSLGIIILVFIFYYRLMGKITEESITDNFNFWFVSSQLIYHLGAFFIFLSLNMFTRKFLSGQNTSENQDILIYLWGVHNVLLFLGSLLTWFGVLWIVYHRKSRSS